MCQCPCPLGICGTRSEEDKCQETQWGKSPARFWGAWKYWKWVFIALLSVFVSLYWCTSPSYQYMLVCIYVQVFPIFFCSFVFSPLTVWLCRMWHRNAWNFTSWIYLLKKTLLHFNPNFNIRQSFDSSIRTRPYRPFKQMLNTISRCFSFG